MPTAPMSKVYTDTPQNVVTPTVDLEAAKQFLGAFGGSHTFQTFDDTGQNRSELARIFHGGAEHLPQLAELNTRGAGVFLTVNKTDQRGRKAENITAVRAVFVDLDGAPLQLVIDAARVAGIEPHLIVETSPGKYHVYWMVEGVKPEHFSAAQRALAMKFGGDPKVCDLPRVMRVPGFLHQKKQPFHSVQIGGRSGPAYLLPALLRGLDLPLGLVSADAAPRTVQGAAYYDGEVVTEGGRNDTLASRAGNMRHSGWSPEAITNALIAENKAICSPPLPEQEVRTIAKSIGKYRPDERASVPVLGYAEIEQKINDTEDPNTLKVRLADLVTVSTMRDAQKETLRKKLAKKAGTSVSALKRDAKRLEDNGGGHFSIAKGAIARLGADNMAYALDGFWQWTGKVWERMHERLVRKTIHAVANESELSSHFVGSVFDLIKTEAFDPDMVFDEDTGVINCQNGELQYRAGKWFLGEHRRDRYLTTLIPVEYDPEATAPRFNRFLCEVFQGDPDAFEKMQLVGEAMGYAITRGIHLEKFFMLIGPGANGKSVLLGVLAELLGEGNIAAVKPSYFQSKFHLAELRGKLANIVTEVAVGSDLSDGIKDLVSGEVVEAEHKYGAPFKFRSFATQFLATNHFPRITDSSEGFTRRAVVLIFNRKFAEAERDIHLAAKLKEELPGILNIALAGLNRIYEYNSLTIPESSGRAIREWLSEADQVSEFVHEACVEGPGLEVTSGALYAAFQVWAVSAGIRQRVTQKTFTSRLENRGFQRTRRGGGTRMIVGLALDHVPHEFYQQNEDK